MAERDGPVLIAPALSTALLDRAAHPRSGLVPVVHDVPMPPSDLPGLANAAVPADPAQPWQTVSGAVGITKADARTGALAEALERIAAAHARFAVTPRAAIPQDAIVADGLDTFFTSAQRAQPDFPWPSAANPADGFAQVYRLRDNAGFWAAQEWVGLGPRQGEPRMPSTSSGLAAHRDAAGGPWLALLRAAEEVLERDALTVTWLHGLGGREVPLPAAWADAVAARGGHLHAFDLTQAWNPHPVIAVAGGLPQEGEMRHGLGVACRADPAHALDKAMAEWRQSIAFAGHLRRTRASELPTTPAALRRFEEHAAFYTMRPDLWGETPLIRHRTPAHLPAHAAAVHDGPAPQLQALVQHLASAGIDLYYRELTPPDVAETGLRVMRVIAPRLASLHADERAPFLGGSCAQAGWRYPGAAARTPFPNPLPHPLG